MEMNVEDEYFSVIEKRDTELLQSRKELAAKDAQLEQQSAQLQQKDAQLKSSVRMLMAAGQSAESISSALGLSVDEIIIDYPQSYHQRDRNAVFAQ